MSGVSKMWLFILVAMFGVFNARASSQAFKELEHFLTDNGHQYVDIIYNSSSSTNWVAFRPRSISVARFQLHKVRKAANEAFGIFTFETEKDELMPILQKIFQQKVKMSLLLFIEPSVNSESTLKKHLDILKAAGLFYMAVLNKSAIISWYQVMTLKTGTVMQQLTFAENTFRIVENYNLQGLRIRSTTLTWAPFLTINDCNKTGLACMINYGYLKDYMDALALKFNFTYTSHRNTDNDWGVIPKKGPYSINGTWGGVMGDVINKEYDLSISTWYWKADRVELVQFVPVVRGRMVLVSSLQNPKTDFGLLSRGFTNVSWMGVFLMLLIVHIFILLAKVIGPKGRKGSLKIMFFSMALMFVMIRAFYSAALTKFFTVSIPQPFETERDVIRAYPSWNFMIRKGEEMNIYSYVLQGDADYAAYWQRHLSDPEGTTYTSEKEAIQHLASGRYVISSDENQFLGYLRSNPTGEKLHFFGHGRWHYPCLMFHLNSPLVPMFNRGVGHFREKGLESQLYLKWIGVGYNDGPSLLSMTVLTPGQVVMAFTFIMSIYMLSLIVLGAEVLAKRIMVPSSTRSRNDPHWRRASI